MPESDAGTNEIGERLDRACGAKVVSGRNCTDSTPRTVTRVDELQLRWGEDWMTNTKTSSTMGTHLDVGNVDLLRDEAEEICGGHGVSKGDTAGDKAGHY